MASPPHYFFMIKELGITMMLMAPSIQNTWVPQTHRDTSNIQTYGNIISNETFDTNNNLTLGKYYAVKEFTNTMEVGKATITAKGYQYTYYSTEEEGSAYQIIDYYFKMTYAQDNDLNFNEINLYLKGNYNPNGYRDMYFTEYSIYAQNTETAVIETFLANPTYTYQQLETLRNTSLNIHLSNNVVDTVDSYCNITVTSQDAIKPKYLKISYTYAIDYANITDITPMNMIATTQNIWTTCSAAYTYSYNVQYNYEVVDIPGLLFTILGMPFAWLSTAFNLTIFPGTPYAINISHIMFAIIGALILIVILKKILK